MSNFIKSIVYSSVVMAVGLVAIFAIYNNMSQQGANFASLEPAAGEAVITQSPAEEAITVITEEISGAATETEVIATETLEEMMIEIDTETSKTATETKEIEVLIENTEPAAGETMEETIKNAIGK